MVPQKVVICGAGFIGSHIAHALAAGVNHIQLASRRPEKAHAALQASGNFSKDNLLSPISVDITQPSTLQSAFKGAQVVISLVGLLHGTSEEFDKIQWKGAENIARAAKDAGAKLVHLSALGADPTSPIDSPRTKALGEEAALGISSDTTIFRPSIVFGKGDGFFTRFARLTKYLPFLPVFDGGQTRFQPVYVGDIARAVEICTRLSDPAIRRFTDGKVIEAGGPDVFTYKQIMELVLRYTNRTRPIISLPYAVGRAQGLIFEQLPPNIFTLTRAQVAQLQLDNVVNPSTPSGHASFSELLLNFDNGAVPKSVHEVLPTYLR